MVSIGVVPPLLCRGHDLLLVESAHDNEWERKRRRVGSRLHANGDLGFFEPGIPSGERPCLVSAEVRGLSKGQKETLAWYLVKT